MFHRAHKFVVVFFFCHCCRVLVRLWRLHMCIYTCIYLYVMYIYMYATIHHSLSQKEEQSWQTRLWSDVQRLGKCVAVSVSACVRACVCECVRACVWVCVLGWGLVYIKKTDSTPHQSRLWSDVQRLGKCVAVSVSEWVSACVRVWVSACVWVGVLGWGLC